MMNRQEGILGVLFRLPVLALCIGCLSLTSFGCAGSAPAVIQNPAQEPPKGVLAPVAGGAPQPLSCTFNEATQSDKARTLVMEGIALHDSGDYSAAIGKYQEALAGDRENLIALYELSASEMLSGRNQEAAEHAAAGVRCASPYRLGFFVNLGSALDNLKNPGAAIAAFEEGLADPAVADASVPLSKQTTFFKELLLYNLSMTLLHQGRTEDAKRRAEQAALLRPEHPSPYLVLGAAHGQLGNRIPSLLALLRFICLEPTTARSKDIAAQVLALLEAGVDREKKTITITAAKGGSEGDFQGIEMIFAMVSAGGDRNAATLRSQIEALSEYLEKQQAAGPQSFTLRYNGPFFAAVQRQGFAEPLAQLVVGLQGNAEARAWIRTNARRVAELVVFAQNFKN